MVRSIGADQVIDYTEDDFASGDQSYDLILDVVGNRSVADYQRVLNPDGVVLLIGFTTMAHLFKSIAVGAWVSKRSHQKIAPMNANITPNDLGVLKRMVETGKVKPVIDRYYPFHEIPEAMAYLETGRARGKVAIRLGAGEH